MKTNTIVLALLIACALSTATNPLVSSFMTHLTSTLSLLPEEEIEKEFDVR